MLLARTDTRRDRTTRSNRPGQHIERSYGTPGGRAQLDSTQSKRSLSLRIAAPIRVECPGVKLDFRSPVSWMLQRRGSDRYWVKTALHRRTVPSISPRIRGPKPDSALSAGCRRDTMTVRRTSACRPIGSFVALGSAAVRPGTHDSSRHLKRIERVRDRGTNFLLRPRERSRRRRLAGCPGFRPAVPQPSGTALSFVPRCGC